MTHRFLIRALAIPALLILSHSTAFAAKHPNVVFILSDNQSYYEMSCHGHADIKTPHIDRLADQSVEFTNFHAPPICSPSRAVILTGRYAIRSGVFTTIAGRSILHKDEKTLPQFLKPHGYHSAIFGKWYLGFSYPYRPPDRGFDEVFVHGGGGVGQMEDYFGNSLFDTTFIYNGKVSPSKGYCTDVLFDRAMDYVEAKQKEKQPFCCFVSTPVTHSPHHGPRADDKKAGASKAEIRIGDHTAETDLVEGDKKATFELTLEAGDYDLEAWFAKGRKRFGALWVYVKKL
jgi:arylsulfatase A-like enzyme